MELADFEGVEAVLDEVLATPPKAFVEARNAAARQLREDGRRDAADAIKGLPRPPVSLWALNRLAHRQPALIETFLRAADRLREAHGSGGDIRAATAPERAAEARVVAAASELAQAEGLSVTEGVVERVRQTMRAAAADAGIAGVLRAGRLLREPEAPSIDALLGSLPQAAAAAAPAAETSPRETRERARRELREQITAAKAHAADARGEERAAAQAASKAHEVWKRAQAVADRAARRSEAAAKLLDDLRQRLAEL
jgi:hypothetical protein